MVAAFIDTGLDEANLSERVKCDEKKIKTADDVFMTLGAVYGVATAEVVPCGAAQILVKVDIH